MAKPFKIFLWIVAGLVSLIGVAAIALVLLFNPNGYKGKISGTVKQNTGRDLVINGNIKLTLLPWLGASVSDVTLSNAEGFGPEPFAHVGDMNVGIKLMPLLFGGKVEVAKIHVDGLALNLAKHKDGKTNWQDLSKPEEGEQKPQPEHPAGPHNEFNPNDLTIGGIDIKNVAFSYVDQQADKSYKVDKLEVSTGEIRLDHPIDVAIAFLVSTTNPQLDSDVKIAFTANSNLQTKVYEIKDLKFESTTKGPTVPGGSQKAKMTANAVYDGGKGTFALNDGVLEAANLKVNTTIQAEALTTDTPHLSGKIATNTFSPKDLAKSFGIVLPPTSDPSALTQASFATNLAGTPKAAKLDALTIKLDQTTATGTVAIDDVAKQSIEFALKADAFNADRYMAPGAAGGGEAAKKDDGGDFKKTEIPVEALDSVNAHGTIALDSLTAKGLKMTGIKIVINALKGQPKTEELTALLYGGKITQSVKFSHASPVHYDFNVGLDAINSAPLLKDLTGKTFLSGLGNFQMKASSGGTTVGAILESLSGTVGLGFVNGALEGFNLDQTLSGAKAMLNGQAAPASDAPNRTEFKDLKAAGDILNGVVNMKSLDMKGAGYQLGGAGKINLVDQTLDYTLLPTVSGDKYKELAGTKVPIQITGSWSDPKVKLDAAGLVKGRAQQEINKQKDKAKEKFGDFLRKQLGGQQQQPQQPQQQPAQTPPKQ